VRDARLHLIGTMRSNDAYLGLPHDVFAFTMLQEIVARAVGVELGEYIHFAGSLHLYAEHYEKADAYIREDWQALVPMPEMPGGDPWPSIAGVLAFEALSRDNCASELPDDMDPYWADLCRLLAAFRCARNGDSAALKNLLKTLVNRGYAVFLQSRIDELEVRMPSARK
jgi:thymidylate synthase